MPFPAIWGGGPLLSGLCSLPRSQEPTTYDYPERIGKETVVRCLIDIFDRLCGLVVRVLRYRFGGTGSIRVTTRKKKVVGLERGPLSLVSTTEELLDRKVAAPV
jgi:hypothetical protein